MKAYYETWMQQERVWIKAIEDERKKKVYLHFAISVVSCVAILAGIGFLAGGAGPAVSNIKYGLILGIVGGGMYAAIMLSSHTADKYMKRLEKEMDNEMKSEEEKEQFACAMLGGTEGTEPADCMEFVRQKGAVPEKFSVCGNIALFRGMIPCMVRLDRLERMEVDVVQSVSTVHAGEYKIRLNYSTYPIFFYYKKSQMETSGSKKQKLDKMMVFPSEKLRDQAAKMINKHQD